MVSDEFWCRNGGESANAPAPDISPRFALPRDISPRRRARWYLEVKHSHFLGYVANRPRRRVPRAPGVPDPGAAISLRFRRVRQRFSRVSHVQRICYLAPASIDRPRVKRRERRKKWNDHAGIPSESESPDPRARFSSRFSRSENWPREFRSRSFFTDISAIESVSGVRLDLFDRVTCMVASAMPQFCCHCNNSPFASMAQVRTFFGRKLHFFARLGDAPIFCCRCNEPVNFFQLRVKNLFRSFHEWLGILLVSERIWVFRFDWFGRQR